MRGPENPPGPGPQRGFCVAQDSGWSRARDPFASGKIDSSPPILDASLADQRFAEEDDQGKEDGRRVVDMLRHDLEPRLVALCQNPGQLTGPAAEHEFHRIRGAVGSFGFARCASHLLILEKNWIQLDEGRRQAELQATRAAFDAGLQALLARFPYLA